MLACRCYLHHEPALYYMHVIFFEQAQTSTGCFFQTEGVTTHPEFWNDQQMTDVTISLFYWSQQNQDK